MKYKAVGFDNTGVIVGISASKFHQIVCNILSVSVENFNNVYADYSSAFNEGKTTREEFWKSILKDLNRESFYEEIVKVLDKPREINKEVVTVIKELKVKGFKLGILSNETLEGGRMIREVEKMNELFDLIVISAETGLAKPSRDAFNDFMKKLDVLPEELIYIDDAKRNITTARELGITAILCVEPNDVRKQLEELEVF